MKATDTNKPWTAWRVDPLHSGDVQTVCGKEIASVFSRDCVGKEWEITGDIPWSQDEADDHARLISAAPDMAEALEAGVEYFQHLSTRTPEDAQELFTTFRAALQKARGGES